MLQAVGASRFLLVTALPVTAMAFHRHLLLALHSVGEFRDWSSTARGHVHLLWVQLSVKEIQ